MMSLIQILHRNQHLPEISLNYKGGVSALHILLLKFGLVGDPHGK
jgi:hypothetical protein